MDESSAGLRPTTSAVPQGVSALTWRRFLRGATSLVPVLVVEDGDMVRGQAGIERRVVERTFTSDGGRQTVNLHLAPTGQDGGQPEVFPRPAAAYVQATRPVSRRVFIVGRLRDAARQLWSTERQDRIWR